MTTHWGRQLRFPPINNLQVAKPASQARFGSRQPSRAVPSRCDGGQASRRRRRRAISRTTQGRGSCPKDLFSRAVLRKYVGVYLSLALLRTGTPYRYVRGCVCTPTCAEYSHRVAKGYPWQRGGGPIRRRRGVFRAIAGRGGRTAHRAAKPEKDGRRSGQLRARPGTCALPPLRVAVRGSRTARRVVRRCMDTTFSAPESNTCSSAQPSPRRSARPRYESPPSASGRPNPVLLCSALLGSSTGGPRPVHQARPEEDLCKPPANKVRSGGVQRVHSKAAETRDSSGRGCRLERRERQTAQRDVPTHTPTTTTGNSASSPNAVNTARLRRRPVPRAACSAAGCSNCCLFDTCMPAATARPG